MATNELSDRLFIREVAPSEDRAHQPQPDPVPGSECEGDGCSFVLAQESVDRDEAFPPDLHSRRGTGPEVAHPVDVWAPA
jgi:hypothetical protein